MFLWMLKDYMDDNKEWVHFYIYLEDIKGLDWKIIWMNALWKVGFRNWWGVVWQVTTCPKAPLLVFHIPGILRLHVCADGMHFKRLPSSLLMLCCFCQALHNRDILCTGEFIINLVMRSSKQMWWKEGVTGSTGMFLHKGQVTPTAGRAPSCCPVSHGLVQAGRSEWES